MPVYTHHVTVRAATPADQRAELRAAFTQGRAPRLLYTRGLEANLRSRGLGGADLALATEARNAALVVQRPPELFEMRQTVRADVQTMREMATETEESAWPFPLFDEGEQEAAERGELEPYVDAERRAAAEAGGAVLEEESASMRDALIGVGAVLAGLGLAWWFRR